MEVVLGEYLTFSPMLCIAEREREERRERERVGEIGRERWRLL